MVFEPGVRGGAIVVLDVGVILVGGKLGSDVRYAVCQPAGMGDREEIPRPVSQADRSTDAGEVEPPGEIESAAVLPGPFVVK